MSGIRGVDRAIGVVLLLVLAGLVGLGVADNRAAPTRGRTRHIAYRHTGDHHVPGCGDHGPHRAAHDNHDDTGARARTGHGGR